LVAFRHLIQPIVEASRQGRLLANRQSCYRFAQEHHHLAPVERLGRSFGDIELLATGSDSDWRRW
jgi:hypothetical protein